MIQVKTLTQEERVGRQGFHREYRETLQAYECNTGCNVRYDSYHCMEKHGTCVSCDQV